MRRALFSIIAALLLAFGFDAAVIAQTPGSSVNDEKCVGRIYEPKEVSLRPKISSKPSPGYSKEAIAHNVRGRVVLKAVLCRTGKVTNIQVIESLPFGMTEKAIAAARAIEFEPAERNGRRVSEVFRLEYNFGFIGDRGSPAQEPTAGRLIERLEITGLRSRGLQEIMALLKTRPGEPYRQEQVEADFQSLLALGFLDRLNTRVRLEEGMRGGVIVVFDLVELQPKWYLDLRFLQPRNLANCAMALPLRCAASLRLAGSDSLFNSGSQTRTLAVIDRQVLGRT